MPFINEQIPPDEKVKINWRQFTCLPWDVFFLRNPSHWTIDRDRGVFFVQIYSGDPERGPPPTYTLWYEGEIIRVVTTGPTEWAQRDSGVWEIEVVDVPKHLESQRSVIVDLLKEAISAFGWNYNGESYRPREIRIIGSGTGN